MSESTPSQLQIDEENREPCPTPLAWQEVVQEFQKEIRQGPIQFNGGQVFATQFGTGVPLVFLPGSLSSVRLYALIAWLLKDCRQCWLLSHPEFEKPPKTSHLIKATATAYTETLNDLFGGPVDVYASNFGVPVCLEMMATAPQIFRRSALQSGWATRELAFTERSLLQFGQFLPFSIKRVPLWLAVQIQNHRPWFPPFDETRFGFLLNETYLTSIKDVARRLLASSKTDLTSQLPEIGTRTLVIRCEGDGASMTSQQELIEILLPNCESAWLHTTGHYPYLTHPHRLLKAIREFFEIDVPLKQPVKQSLN